MTTTNDVDRRKFRKKNSYDWKPVFLATLAETGMVGRSARRAGISPESARRARDIRKRRGADLIEAQAFKRAWAAAVLEARENMEMEARRRAVEGVEQERKVFYHGEQVGMQTVRVYSDRLLMFLITMLRADEQRQELEEMEVVSPKILEATEALAQKRWAELLPLLAEIEEEDEAVESEEVRGERQLISGTVTDKLEDCGSPAEEGEG